MELTKHQKEIVCKILAEEIYDISSYLKVFGKFSIAKYDTEALSRRFEDSENGEKYKVMKKGQSIFTTVQKTMSLNGSYFTCDVPALRDKESITADELEYQKATLENAPKYVKYKEYSFKYNFLEGVFVANDFEDIKEFITLWSYLKREALVLEVNKTLESDDISVFFQLGSVESTYDEERACDIGMLQDSDIYTRPPTKYITSFLDEDWNINQEHLLVCEEFIGKKILPISDLKIYESNKFKTSEEVANRRTLIVAWIAVAISLISIFDSSILPLFKSKDSDYLIAIRDSVNAIVEQIDDLNLNPGTVQDDTNRR